VALMIINSCCIKSIEYENRAIQRKLHRVSLCLVVKGRPKREEMGMGDSPRGVKALACCLCCFVLVLVIVVICLIVALVHAWFVVLVAMAEDFHSTVKVSNKIERKLWEINFIS